MNDRDHVSEEELHAYVDNELPADRRTVVEAWLSTHPDDAARVVARRKQAAKNSLANLISNGLGKPSAFDGGNAELHFGTGDSHSRRNRVKPSFSFWVLY